MASKAIWKGSIGFGMAHVPVKLMTAVRENEPKFKRWHAPSQSYPKQVQMIGEEIVPLSEMTSVFDTGTSLVEITEEDRLRIAPTSKRHMQINEFVPRDSIDPIYIEKTYFLVPDGADFAYALLRKALEDRQVAAVARVMMRTKEHLVAIYVNRGALCLSTMFYDSEIVANNGVFGDLMEIDQVSLNTACELVDAYSSEAFNAANYKDIYTESLLEMIALKEQGKTPESSNDLHLVKPGDIIAVLRNELEEMKGVAA